MLDPAPIASQSDKSFRDLRVQIRERRLAAGLSLREMARRSHVSESMLRDLETCRRPLTARMLSRLLSVVEIDLEDPTFNCWIAPDYDPVKMVKDLAAQLGGCGGLLDQTSFYLEPMSAACWQAISDQESYSALNRAKPLDRAAQAICRAAGGGAGLDMLGLGCGEGRLDSRLAQYLADFMDPTDLRVYLLDISQPLLNMAYRHAAEALRSRKGVRVAALQGNFYHLPRYMEALRCLRREDRKRVVCMLGATFGNLENEVLFLRGSLGGFAEGDLLLLDVNRVFAPVDQPEEIHARDPWLSSGRRVRWGQEVVDFLTGPLRRYGGQGITIDLSAKLGNGRCPVPGSYAIEIEARMESAGHLRTFTIFQIKRYDAIALVGCLRQLGWDPIDGWPYGEDPQVSYPGLLYLFRRRGRLAPSPV